MMATPISRGIKPIARIIAKWFLFPTLALALTATPARAAGTNRPSQAPPTATIDVRARAQKEFLDARNRYQSQKTNAEAAWQFARACFDLADAATNNTERAQVAQVGIDAARGLIARQPRLAAGHYYLAMNLGELAETKSLGALKLVSEMERECLAARGEDEDFDFGGPDRNLGLLYRDAPAIISVGSRARARQCLRHAADLAPDYPENRLNLVESYLQWHDIPTARVEMKKLQEILPAAQKKFSGDAWASSWADWYKRIAAAGKKIDEAPKSVESPKNTGG